MMKDLKKYDIPITRVKMGDAEIEAVSRVIRSGWIVQGKEVATFERKVANLCQVEHAVAVSSCSTGLHAAVKALGVGPGDEVIVPGFTWVSTANAVVHCGATPVFADIELDSLNLSLHKVESLITEKTKGIIIVHLFGLMVDVEAFGKLSDQHNLWLLEDAACALGSHYAGHAPGVHSDAAVFSFHPRKSITTGEGGMIVTNNTHLAERLKALRNHGAQLSDHHRHGSRGAFLLSSFPEIGFNFRMTDLQAAIGNVQMDKFPDMLIQREQLAARYDQLIREKLPWLRVPQRAKGRHSYQSCLLYTSDAADD